MEKREEKSDRACGGVPPGRAGGSACAVEERPHVADSARRERNGR